MTYPLATRRFIKHWYGRMPARLIGLRVGKTANQIHDYAHRHGLSSQLGKKKRARKYSDAFYTQLLFDFESQTTLSLANKHGVSLACMEKMLQRARIISMGLTSWTSVPYTVSHQIRTRSTDGTTALHITMSPTTL